MSEKPVINYGLEGIYVDESAISKVDGQNGKLWYRGYSIENLAEQSNFEEISYLLLNGNLPTNNQYEEFVEKLKERRDLPKEVKEVIKVMAPVSHPMDVMRTATSMLVMYDKDPNNRESGATMYKVVTLLAKLPTIAAATGRFREGKDYISPDHSLGHSANFLYMLTGKKPNEFESKLIDLMFILHAEHSTNASTFSVLVTASTLADVYSATTSGIGTLKGSLHGGADEAALNMMNAIGDPNNTEKYIEEALEGKQRIMGFGHRVYKTYDPRAKLVRSYLEESLTKEPLDEVKRLLQIVLRAEKLMIDKLGKTKGIWPNIDFFAGPLYRVLGIDSQMFTPIFVASRMAGWGSHVVEYWHNNKLVRPVEWYTGSIDLPYVPMNKR
ncbi:MAG: citrate/2-methylcitrate synthase [Thermoplasmatales archaeon]|nr:citrate/2-methylcitrate synthase [Candidatus Thermoplasmatota archaeon]MCL6002825.1 citrate/2-methylcitrate synthase [Candidatus Thermoplasmatota archaeon]MDA8054313.1 citrate/2-methylcitrate synthase [Thermoplasmatales archaeon]